MEGKAGGVRLRVKSSPLIVDGERVKVLKMEYKMPDNMILGPV